MHNVKRHIPLTSLTGRWGSGDWWAVRWTFDGKEGHGNGETEYEALAAAERDAQENG
jgi:hypothetical protein